MRGPEKNRWAPTQPWAAFIAVVVCGASAMSGCGPFRGQYSPRIPMRARSGDVDVTLSYVAAGRDLDFVFATKAESAHTMRQAWITEPTRDPCSGGEHVDELIVDDGQTGTLPSGVHSLRASVGTVHDEFELDAVMDIQIDDDRGCVRTPLVSQSVPLVGRRRPFLIFDAAVDWNGALSGLADLVSLRLGAGTWLGPILGTGEIGVGVAQCETSLCGGDSNSVRSHTSVSVAVGADYSVASGVVLGAFNDLTAGVRYSFSPITLPALSGDRSFDVHGIRAVLGWSLGYGVNGPFQHRERGPMMQINFPIGVAYAPAGPEERAAFSAGFEWRWLLPI